MSNYRVLAQKIRWWLLAIGVTCMVAGLWWIYQWENHLVVFGALLLLQWMFLCPGRRWRIRMSEQARPMRMAVIAAASMAMLLSVGLLATLSEIYPTESWVELWKKLGGESGSPWHIYGIIMAALWLFWTGVFWNYRRSTDGFSRVGGLATRLVAGSLLELLVAAGVFAWNPHEEDCWCARGSYVGLVLGGTVLIWAFGPALLPLFLRQSRLRRRAERPD